MATTPTRMHCKTLWADAARVQKLFKNQEHYEVERTCFICVEDICSSYIEDIKWQLRWFTLKIAWASSRIAGCNSSQVHIIDYASTVAPFIYVHIRPLGPKTRTFFDFWLGMINASAPPLSPALIHSNFLFLSTKSSAHFNLLRTSVWPRDGSSAMLLFEGTLANQEIIEASDSSGRMCSKRWDAMLLFDLQAMKESRTALLSMKKITCFPRKVSAQTSKATDTAKNSHS